jgi:cellobiose-specific phosphotransferase system component IIC
MAFINGTKTKGSKKTGFMMTGKPNNIGSLMLNREGNIYLQGFWDFYLLIGGIGSTLPLVFMAIRSRSRQLSRIPICVKYQAIQAFINGTKTKGSKKTGFMMTAAWSANGSWKNMCMCLFAFFNAWMLYRPFFKVHERQLTESAFRVCRIESQI